MKIIIHIVSILYLILVICLTVESTKIQTDLNESIVILTLIINKVQCLKLKSRFPELKLNCEELFNKEVKNQNEKEDMENRIAEENLQQISNIETILTDITSKVSKVKSELNKLKSKLKVLLLFIDLNLIIRKVTSTINKNSKK